MKKIEGFPDYSITEDGRVWSHKTKKWLKPRLNTRKYKFVSLCKNREVKQKTVHRLVAETYLPNPENRPEVDHIDGNKLNNHVSNLQWLTTSEHARKDRLGSKHGYYDHTLYRWLNPDNGLIISTQYDLRMKYDLIQPAISDIIRGKRKSHKGFKLIGKLTIDCDHKQV